MAKYDVKYNTGSAPTGTTQSNHLAFATGNPDYTQSGWVAGVPDDGCYIFVSNTTDLSIAGRSAGAGASTIQSNEPTFWKTNDTSDAEVLRVINRLPHRPQDYNDASAALTWVRSSSYYVVYPQPPSGSLVTTGNTTNSTIVSQSPFGGGGNAYYTTGSITSYVSVPGQLGYAFGTDDFTVEWFQYEASDQSFPRIFWYGAGGTSSPSFGVSEEGASGGVKTFYVWSPGPNSIGTTINISSTWIHYALVRISGRLYVYQNGTIMNSGGLIYTNNFTDSSSTFYIGSKAGGMASECFAGFITNFRVVKGLGVYTGNFTKPTSALTSTSSANPYGGSNTVAIPAGYTKLLLVP
jgi:hypothetical protein